VVVGGGRAMKKKVSRVIGFHISPVVGAVVMMNVKKTTKTEETVIKMVTVLKVNKMKIAKEGMGGMYWARHILDAF
jgi:hypothetical protein